MNETITAIPGVEVGHWTDPVARTGCTVIVLPEPNTVAAETRGAAPGSRETALLEPGMAVEQCQAILLTGGSAFGLAAADGVVRELEGAGRGHTTPAGPVPIVPAAVVFDLMEGDPAVRPGPEQGAVAYRSRTSDPVALGRVGAGAGVSVAKWRMETAPAGIGSAVARRGGATVGALVVLNAVGDIFTLEGEALTGGPHIAAAPAFEPEWGQNTTLVVVATDARLNRSDLTRLAVRGQDALAACIRPVHTRFDGDTCFAVSCGEVDVPSHLVAEAVFEAVGRAIQSAVRESAG
ncbi:MAG: P1 family peptidase [Acidimicrobiia bacterium]|nr:P1 family peptidase [Acidimicrobiia bacterium]